MIYIFRVTPRGKPRMTRADAWKDRKAVTDYWLFKDRLNLEARRNHYELTPQITIIFYIPMPDSWSKKKKDLMRGKPHQQKPDFDNLAKAFTDALTGDDAFIYDAHVIKYWSDVGKIEVIKDNLTKQ